MTAMIYKTNYDEDATASHRTKAAGKYNCPHIAQIVILQISW